MPRGRPKKHDTPVSWYVSLPQSLAAEVELILLDPLTGRPEFGKRSQLVESLLRNWVEEMRLTGGANSARLNSYGPHSDTESPASTNADPVRPNDGGSAGGPPPSSSGEGTGNG